MAVETPFLGKLFSPLLANEAVLESLKPIILASHEAIYGATSTSVVDLGAAPEVAQTKSIKY